MNDQRPTRWPCSADSSRKAGYSGVRPRSLRNAETGVSQSSMNVWRSGTRLCSRASARTSSSDGSTATSRTGVPATPGVPAAVRVSSAPAGTQDLLRVRQRAPARAQEHQQVIEDVGRLGVDALVGLLARGTGDLLGLLLHLLADVRRIVEQRDGVRALGALGLALQQRALEARQDLVRRRRLEVAGEEARARAGVARGAGGLDEREQRVAVAVQAQRADGLGVARRGALVPELAARARPQVQLPRLARQPDGLGVRVG